MIVFQNFLWKPTLDFYIQNSDSSPNVNSHGKPISATHPVVDITRCAGSRATEPLRLVHHEGGGGDDGAEGGEAHAAEPEDAALGEHGEGCEHEAELHAELAQVKTVGLVMGVLAARLEVLRLLLQLAR